MDELIALSNVSWLSKPFPHDPSAAAQARRFVTESLARLGRSECIEDAMLVATELVENVVEHTGAPGELKLATDGDMVLIAAGDSSPTLPFVVERPNWGSMGGRGLYIVREIASSWGVEPIEDDGKLVWAALRCPE